MKTQASRLCYFPGNADLLIGSMGIRYNTPIGRLPFPGEKKTQASRLCYFSGNADLLIGSMGIRYNTPIGRLPFPGEKKTQASRLCYFPGNAEPQLGYIEIQNTGETSVLLSRIQDTLPPSLRCYGGQESRPVSHVPRATVVT